MSPAHIGPSVVIKGSLSASEPVSIAGRIEGEIDLSGQELTLQPGSEIHADVVAGRAVVAGVLRGEMTAETRVELRETADVEGSVTAPVLAVSDGALVRGTFHTAPRTALAQAS